MVYMISSSNVKGDVTPLWTWMLLLESKTIVNPLSHTFEPSVFWSSVWFQRETKHSLCMLGVYTCKGDKMYIQIAML